MITTSMRRPIRLWVPLVLVLGACQSALDPSDRSVQTSTEKSVRDAPMLPESSTSTGSPGTDTKTVTPLTTLPAGTESAPTIGNDPLDTPEPAILSAPPKPARTRSSRALAGQSRLYDRKNPAFAQLQQANQALAGFPADRMGRVDWMAALRLGLIKPRASRDRLGQMLLRESEIIMKNTREMPWVRFPHAAHTEWLDCTNCHEKPFKSSEGANEITMNAIFAGRACGACHDRVSFSVFVCERCHSVTHAGSPDAWWSQ